MIKVGQSIKTPVKYIVTQVTADSEEIPLASSKCSDDASYATKLAGAPRPARFEYIRVDETLRPLEYR